MLGLDLQTRQILVLAVTVVAVLVGTALIFRSRRDLVESGRPCRRDVLQSAREAFRQGLMDRDEYDRICAALEHFDDVPARSPRPRPGGESPGSPTPDTESSDRRSP